MIQRVKGTRDILPPQSRLWAAVESEALRVFSGFGYDEIRLPALEPTELFVRGVGEGTDIVAKEMYTFTDRKGRSLTLRPEGTAGVARAFIENSLTQWPQPVRLLYMGPMFRYEKMQRGRFRQFSQIGIELLGAATPEADVEVLLALHTFLGALAFDEAVILLNNLGDPDDRPRFIATLKAELAPNRSRLCEDCQRRFETNPLRILDCKEPSCQQLVAATTPVEESVSEESRQHVTQVEKGLSSLGIPVRRAPRLVRGLDYYLRTVFEVVVPALGEDTAVCGGGRYDRLIADLGGPQVPGIGFAIGEDRLVEVLDAPFRKRVLDRRLVALIPLGEEPSRRCLQLARSLVENGISCQVEVTGRSLKAGLKWAAKMEAAVAVIVGESELAAGTATVRDFARAEQTQVALAEVVGRVASLLGASKSGGAS